MQAWLLLLTDSTDNKRMNGHWAVHIVLYLQCAHTAGQSCSLSVSTVGTVTAGTKYGFKGERCSPPVEGE